MTNEFPEHVVHVTNSVLTFVCPTTNKAVTVNFLDKVTYEGQCATYMSPSSHEVIVSCPACIQGYHVIAPK